MPPTQALQKIADLLEDQESFVVLSLDEYEDLLLSTSPYFQQAMEESLADVKAGRVYSWKDVQKELGLDGKAGSHRKGQKRSKKVR